MPHMTRAVRRPSSSNSLISRLMHHEMFGVGPDNIFMVKVNSWLNP